MTRVAWLDGELVDFARASVPLIDRGLQFGESLYEVVAVTGGRVRDLPAHARRMQQGAEFVGLEGGVPDLDQWQHIADRLCGSEDITEGILYAQVTGGTAPRQHLPSEPPTPRFFAYLAEHRFPRAADAERGIAAITLPDPRWEHSDLKTTMLLPAVLARKEAAARGAGEALLFSPDGRLREGAATSALIVEEKAVVAPEVSHHLLPGTTRNWLGPMVAELGLELVTGDIDLERLYAAREVFVTSTTVLAMPVVKVDDVEIGTGRGGEVATALAARFRRHLKLEE